MNKRVFSILLCLMLLVGLAVPVQAEQTEPAQEPVVQMQKLTISTTDAFLEFAENCRLDVYSENLSVSLEADIDLKGISFGGIPTFGGIFNGNGYTVSGLKVEGSGSVLGLFRYVRQDALVQNLRVEGSVAPAGSRGQLGGIAGNNAGTILNCSFDGNIVGGDKVGGIAGINSVTGIVQNCTVSGKLQGSHFVGGLVGENFGVVRDCVNNAPVNTEAQQNKVELSDITMETLTDSESVNVVTDIGGICGTSTGVIRSCQNTAAVGYQQMGYNVGGIAGTQSGYITDCENTGNVQGRKEVGGIVGQMEPQTKVEYSEDTLQILQGQLNEMSGLVNQASGNAQAGANQITGQIGVLQEQTQTARDAVEILIPKADNPVPPDADTILAAQNTLTATMDTMPQTMSGIASAAQNTVAGLSRDLQAVSGHIGAMSATINGASENLGGTVTDVSDQDTAEDFGGKVENCVNYGSVLADMNVGGIAGAMAMENDMDLLEELEVLGDESLNASSEVRAVILNCENKAPVTAKKQNAGGIAGWQSLGLVKGVLNTAAVEGADYVGGVSGLSTGFIRNANAKCPIYGSTYVGGIAGSATIATNCRSMVSLHNGTEKLGAILGTDAQSQTEVEDPIAGNYYLAMAEDVGAVDGISYAGKAQPLQPREFFGLAGLPSSFRDVTVHFVLEDGTQKRITVAPGASIAPENIPAVPEKAGFTGYWEGLEEADLNNILFDTSFRAAYKARGLTIASPQTREDGRPVLLLQGSFSDNATVSVEQTQADVPLEEKQTLLEVWKFISNEQGTTARFLLPKSDFAAEQLKIYVGSDDGSWTDASCYVDGSYLVFDLVDGDCKLALVDGGKHLSPFWIGAGVSLATFVIVMSFLWVVKKRPKEEAKD